MSDMVDLLRKAKQGDENAMLDLMVRFDPLMIKLSKRNSTYLDEDCYQELSIQFVTAVKKFDLKKYTK
ncbi:helix-turn-helix domain-containing protein [Enterococcus casseliflavus]